MNKAETASKRTVPDDRLTDTMRLVNKTAQSVDPRVEAETIAILDIIAAEREKWEQFEPVARAAIAALDDLKSAILARKEK